MTAAGRYALLLLIAALAAFAIAFAATNDGGGPASRPKAEVARPLETPPKGPRIVAYRRASSLPALRVTPEATVAPTPTPTPTPTVTPSPTIQPPTATPPSGDGGGGGGGGGG